ncbi:MAG: DUF3618 domain-containing protein [Gemmatimonadaceae bacterium]
MSEKTVEPRRSLDGGVAEAAAIQSDISATRERMSHTLGQIGERLNPQHLKDKVKEGIHDATIGKVKNMAQKTANRVQETGHSITDTIRENPIPAALVGVGLGWLFFSKRRSVANNVGRQTYRDSAQSRGGAYSYSDYTSSGSTSDGHGTGFEGTQSTAERVKDRADEIVGDIKEKAGEVADKAKDVASDVGERSRYEASRVEDRFYENPLAIGAIAIAAGVAAGLALPATHKETTLVGAARDRFVDRVREVAAETKDKVENVADRVMDEAKSTAKEAAREEGLTSQPSV